MSADLNMSVEMRGNREELAAMLKVLNYYETVKGAQYNTKRNCAYINFVEITTPGNRGHLEEKKISELAAMAENSNLTLSAGGPYGHYAGLKEVGLFEDMANAAPNAWFSCTISGFVGSADVFYSAELKDGLLTVSASEEDEDCLDQYVNDFTEKVSYSEFCEFFQIDEEEYDEEVYEEFLFCAADRHVFDWLGMSQFFCSDFCEVFEEYFSENEADEDAVENFRKKLCELGIGSADDFSSTVESYTYNPVTGVTTFESNTCDEDDDFFDDDEDDED